MIRLPAIGAAVLPLAALALATFGMRSPKDPGVLTHRDTRGQLQDVELADVVATARAQADGSDGLPTQWCGDERTTDAPNSTTRPQFKVVYAFAADRVDRFGGWKDALQTNVSLIERFLSAESGGSKALRFDMGTSCGAQYVDIQVVPLPGPRAAYADNFGAIARDVQRALPAAAGPRNTIVLADGLSGSTQEYGLGESVMGRTGEVAGSTNIHNRGGLTAILFSRDGAPAPGPARKGWWAEGMLHEMTHNLGAVQWGAPHSTEPPGQTLPQYGHCWQGADIMCYVEDGGAAHVMVQDCGPLPSAIPQSYDCNRDDYFNPAPAPGSYLATHWNTYDSAFLASCGEIALACGGGTLPAPTPPVATASPAVSGTPRRGATLTAQPGDWRNWPDRYAYQWQRLDRSGWTNLDGEIGTTHVASTADLGHPIRVQVIATNDDGSAAAASAPTRAIGGAGVSNAAKSTHKASRKRASAARKKKRAAAARKNKRAAART